MIIMPVVFQQGILFFGSFFNAKTFDTVESAKKEFEKQKKYILNYKDILSGTLAIREIKFVNVCKL